MILWECGCSYRYVIGKKNVYGPIIPVANTYVGNGSACWGMRMMTREDWEYQYADCARRFEKLSNDE